MDVDEAEDILHVAAIGKLPPCQQYGKRKLEHAGDAMNMQLIQKLDADQKKEEDLKKDRLWMTTTTLFNWLQSAS